MEKAYINKTIRLKPQSGQFVIDELSLLLLCIAGLIYTGMDGVPLTQLSLYLSLILFLYLLYKYLYLRRIRYLIGNEQLVMEYGIFQRKVDYLELYRIIDFNEQQSLMQQLLGLKTIRVFSGDRSTPKLDIIGVKAKEEYVSLIRERVIYNRKVNGIYEVTNR